MSRGDGTVRSSAQRRVEAPMQSVWEHVGLTQAWFDTLPMERVTIAPDRRSANFTAALSFGPVALRREGTVEVVESAPPERVVIEGDLDNGTISVIGTFHLTDGGEGETVLTYEVEAKLLEAMPRLGRLMGGMLDDHVLDLMDHTATVAARHWKAEQAFAREAE